MTPLWQQTININELIARELIKTQHHLSVETISLLDEGWDNVVYLVNNEIIFRFPRRAQGVSCMENEIALLPFIAKHVSFPFSCPSWIGYPSDIYPYPFASYRMIPGKPLCEATSGLVNDASFAKMLADWLKELHTIKVTDDYASLIKGDQTWRLNVKHRISRCEENLSHYEKYFLEAGFDKQTITEIIEFLSHFKFKDTKKSFLHGDLYSRHIIVNPENLLPSGLIDWGDVHVGNPGIDLAAGMVFTEDVLTIFLNTYENIDDETIHILLFHSFCHSMSFLPYAYEQNKSSLKSWASIVLGRAINETQKL